MAIAMDGDVGVEVLDGDGAGVGCGRECERQKKGNKDCFDPTPKERALGSTETPLRSVLSPCVFRVPAQVPGSTHDLKYSLHDK